MTNNVDRFAINLEDVSTERLLVPKGDFEAKLEKATLATGTQKDSDPEAYWYSLNLQYAIKAEEVAKAMNQDSPKAFFNIFISTDKESGKISTNNPDFGSVLAACDLNTKEATAIFIEAGSEATTQHEFNKLFLGKVAELLAGYDHIVKVGHRPKMKGSDEMVAAITKIAKV